MNKKAKLWTRDYILVLFSCICVQFCNYLLSVVTVYSKQLTGSNSMVGIVSASFTVSALLMRSVAGRTIEKIGSKKALLLGAVLTFLASLIYMMSDNIGTLIIGKIVHGIGFGFSITAGTTMVTEIVPAERLLEGISFSSLSSTLGSALGPTLALTIVGRDYSRFSLLFQAESLLALFTIIISNFIHYQYIQQTKQQKITHRSPWGHNHLLLGLSCVVLFVSIIQSSGNTFFTLYLIEKGSEPVSLFFIINAAFNLLSRFFSQKLHVYLGQTKLLVLFLGAMCASLILLTFDAGNWLTYVTGAIYGFSSGIIYPLLNYAIICNAPGVSKGNLNAIYYSMLDMGYTGGAILWGMIAEATNYTQVFHCAAAFTAILALCVYVMERSLLLKKQ